MRDRPSLDDVRDCQARFNLFGDPNDGGYAKELRRAVSPGPLQGRIVGLKANIAVAGTAWTAGLEHRAKHIADTDAVVTRRLRESGALVLPGLNMDAAALGGTTDNPYFGRTTNPHAPEHSVGGSSGGSAAAVAASLVDVAIGTDTLGSVRIPASYCGVYGLKPTYGLIGRSGIVPLAPSLDTVGPMAARAADLWALLQAIAGPDLDDSGSRVAPTDGMTVLADTSVQGLRIGVPRQIETVACEAEVLTALAQAKDALNASGVRIQDVDMPGWQPGKLRHKAFLVTEAEGAVAFSAELNAGGVLPSSVEAMLNFGARMGTAKLVSALYEIDAARAQVQRTFCDVDVLLTPTTPQRAFHAAETAPANQADFTALANAGGVPAVAVPVWLTGSKRPASVQLIGPHWSERTLIQLAQVLETSL